MESDQMTRTHHPAPARRPSARRRAAGLITIGLALSGCGLAKSSPGGPDAGVPKGRVVIDMAVSAEKVTLLTDLAATFNDDKAASTFVGADNKKHRSFVRVTKKASGGAAQLLAQGWPDAAADGPQPAVWSPAASSWGAVLNQRLADQGQPAMAPPSKPFMLTPLVIAMPRPMATALGYPAKAIGWTDILALAKDPKGWGSLGHPEWGAFKLGKTNPNFSTSGLSATIAQYYAGVGKTDGLSLEDLAKPSVIDFAKQVESSVVHYGDITLTFLNNWYRTDQRGTSLTYVSAVAVEEKSLIDYNTGNPDGILDPGEVARPPRIPLVAIYPKEGTLFSDNPFIVLDAPWVTAEQKTGARAFETFVQLPENQRRVLQFGFRPGNPAVSVGPPIIAANGVNPAEPQTTLEVPDPKVLVKLLDTWSATRKAARVLLVLDVSGSMGDKADPKTGETKLDLAKRAAISALDQFRSDDEVGLRVFTSGVGPNGEDELDLVPIGAISAVRETMKAKIADLTPLNGTPLYSVAKSSFEAVTSGYDPTRINAVVLLTDGQNDDPKNSDFTGLLSALRQGAEGGAAQPVRIFSISYGKDADIDTLRRISEATNASAYDASNPKTIEQVFTNVVSNF